MQRGTGGKGRTMSGYQVKFEIGGLTPGPAAGEAGPMIEFLCDPALVGKIPAPERAIRFAPDWFKRLNREMGMAYENGLPAMTAKACLPMTDAFSLGFVIPLPFDKLILL